MNLSTILLSTAVALVLAAIILCGLYRRRHRKCGCHCGCNGCHDCCIGQ